MDLKLKEAGINREYRRNKFVSVKILSMMLILIITLYSVSQTYMCAYIGYKRGTSPISGLLNAQPPWTERNWHNFMHIKYEVIGKSHLLRGTVAAVCLTCPDNHIQLFFSVSCFRGTKNHIEPEDCNFFGMQLSFDGPFSQFRNGVFIHKINLKSNNP